jgi:hypothetical protein
MRFAIIICSTDFVRAAFATHLVNSTTASTTTGSIPMRKMVACTRRSRIANHP